MTKRETGFTIVELMIALLCFGILSTALWQTMRLGSRSSLRGVLQVETTLEARRVMRQIQDDLKSACIPQDSKTLVISFDQVLTETKDPKQYSFLIFPHDGELEQIVPMMTEGRAFTKASRVTYSLKPNENNPFFSLERTVHYHPENPLRASYPEGQRKIVSKRVNQLSIRPFYLPGESPSPDKEGLPGWFQVTLQLVDSLNSQEAKDFGKSTNTAPAQTSNFVIADFFEVVYPEFYNRMFSDVTFNRNWQSGINGPP
ncbi:MAG: prepilin-type N-terminal cleavage/methylation domain-containing protein [Candidatus Riflebacteria bacterium]|nr:prepilin-type N-terminal cleavage/methylation domain-containing protein [Candidatus Riflebacteria bacterium]